MIGNKHNLCYTSDNNDSRGIYHMGGKTAMIQSQQHIRDVCCQLALFALILLYSNNCSYMRCPFQKKIYSEKEIP